MAQFYILFKKSLLFILLVTLTANCIKNEDEDVIFCSNPLFPFFCPSSGKCCSMPVYGKNLESCYATVAECGSSGQSCESCNIEPNNKVALNYIYGNWTCGDPACEMALGGTEGTAGPFCDTATCTAWSNKFNPTTFTCTTLPTHTPTIGSPPDGICFKAGDF